MTFEVPPPPTDGSFDKWAAMREAEQWLVRATFHFEAGATVEAVSEFLDSKPNVPRVRVETDFAARLVRLSFPPDASDRDVETWIDRVVGSGLFVASGT